MRVLVVTASVGAGHTRAADELARRLAAAGCETTTIDALTLGRGEGDRMRQTYAWLLNNLPQVYDLAMRFWGRWPSPLERFVAARARSVEDDLERAVADGRADLVVSLYNLASQCLGRLRVAGRVSVPVMTCVIDPGPHPYWVHSGVDTHLTVLAATAQALREYGARDVQLARPLVPPEFSEPTDRRAVRRRLHLPAGPLALVSAGSWACGRVLDTLDALQEDSDVRPAVLCAHHESLRRRVTRRGGLALGWIDDMAGLLSACDVVVDNAGGLTCWEALTAGQPVVIFNALPGHGRLNAQLLAECGLVRWVRKRSGLVPAVRALTFDAAVAGRQVAAARSALSGPDPAGAVLHIFQHAT